MELRNDRKMMKNRDNGEYYSHLNKDTKHKGKTKNKGRRKMIEKDEAQTHFRSRNICQIGNQNEEVNLNLVKDDLNFQIDYSSVKSIDVDFEDCCEPKVDSSTIKDENGFSFETEIKKEEINFVQDGLNLQLDYSCVKSENVDFENYCDPQAGSSDFVLSSIEEGENGFTFETEIKSEEINFVQDGLNDQLDYSCVKNENIDFENYCEPQAGSSDFEMPFSENEFVHVLKNEFDDTYIKEEKETFLEQPEMASNDLSPSFFPSSGTKISKFFICCFCDFRTVEKIDLRSHIEDVHREFNRVNGNHNSSSPDLPEFGSGELSDSFFPPLESRISKFFVCCFCNFRVLEMEDLKTHIEVVHLKLKPFSCSLCNFSTIEKNLLCTHILSVHLKNFECSNCDFVTNRKQALKRHMEKVHLKVFRCHMGMCDFQAMVKPHLEKHIMAVHLDVKTYECPHCNFTTHYKEDLKAHIDRVHLKLFNCTRCSFKSKVSSGLEKHILKYHLDVNIYQCLQCKFKTFNKNNLKRHMDIVHLHLKRYACTECKYKSNKKRDLDRHMYAKHRCKY